MGVSIVADDNYAAFVQNTSGQAFGPAISVARHGRMANQKVAELVLKKAGGGREFAEMWYSDRDCVHELVADATRELYPAVAPKDDA